MCPQICARRYHVYRKAAQRTGAETVLLEGTKRINRKNTLRITQTEEIVLNIFSIVLLVTLAATLGCSTNDKPEISNPSSSSTTTRTPTDSPDLVVTHIWSTGSTVIYEAKNQGTVKSDLCETYLYFRGNYVASSYTQPLLPGEKRRVQFPNYALPSADIDKGDSELTDAQIQALLTLKVCIDAENDLIESNEDNNCLSETPSQYLDLQTLFKKTQ